ncbi:MAG: diaminopimelate decarboxylase [Myxococcota bacterium]
MTYSYRNGELYCEEVPLHELARDAGTPCFVYSSRLVDDAFQRVTRAVSFADHLVAYAMKANGNLSLLRRLSAAGCGADIVSGGELRRALQAGIPPDRIVFSGVGKTEDELSFALDQQIRSIHVESVQELEAVEKIAKQSQRCARIALRINPDVDPKTHPYIATGLLESKFGLGVETARSLLPGLLRSPHLQFEGLACHIGSQISDPNALQSAVYLVASFARECQQAGAPIRSIDAGGGWPLSYGNESIQYPPWSEFGAAIRLGLEQAGFGPRDLQLIIEPGRALVGDAGTLLTRVLYTKEQSGKRFVIVDGAMTELIRPALYQAHHAVQPVQKPATENHEMDEIQADIVGPVCESGDFLARNCTLPSTVSVGDLLAIRSAGAYSMVMASNYNARPTPPEILVEAAHYRTIRKRQPIEELWRYEL